MFSEFAYGYAVVRELELTAPAYGLHAPYFPTQQLERRAGVGYDVAMNWSGQCLFLQFKRTEEMAGRRSSLKNTLGLPYYRFPVTRRSKSPQHDNLVALASRVARHGHEVAYCAPLFTRYAALDRHYRNRAVLTHRIYISLIGQPTLPDDGQHRYNADSLGSRVVFTSEHEEDVNGERALDAVGRVFQVATKSRAIDVHDALPTWHAVLGELLSIGNDNEDEEALESMLPSREVNEERERNPVAVMRRIQEVALFAFDLAWIPIMRPIISG
jgi:hypothetical protein